MVSKARLDFPDPLTPVKTISLLRGSSSEIFFRLCTRAPRITIGAFSAPFRRRVRCVLFLRIVWEFIYINGDWKTPYVLLVPERSDRDSSILKFKQLPRKNNIQEVDAASAKEKDAVREAIAMNRVPLSLNDKFWFWLNPALVLG